MKKHLLIAGLLCAVTIPPVSAVTKCVKLTPSTTCTSGNAESGQLNWSVTCGGILIQGIAGCGSTKFNAVGTTSDTVTTSTTADNNKYCWCKMISPAVSKWVFNIDNVTASACATSCAANCAGRVQQFPALRGGLFGNLSD